MALLLILDNYQVKLIDCGYLFIFHLLLKEDIYGLIIHVSKYI